ncbi:MAG: DUF4760 domain-containing protein [Pseudomonadales bacterium]|jgi:hypothetical protein
MSFEEFILEMVKIFGVAFGFCLVIMRLKQTDKIFNADHERRKKESTLNAYNAIRDSLREVSGELNSSLGLVANSGTPISYKSLERIVSEKSHRDKLIILLGYIQRLGVGVKHDIYDINVLSDLSGGTFINIFKRYEPYILNVRKQNGSFYAEADDFINKLSGIKNS